MPELSRHTALTDQQRLFVRLTLEGASPSIAGGEAGYKRESDGYRVLAIPQVAAAIHQEIQLQLVTVEAPASLRVLRQIRDDPKAPARVRADIGIKLLHLAGHVAPTTGRDSLPEKQLSEMSANELHAYIETNRKTIDRLEGELANRAKDVTPAAFLD